MSELDERDRALLALAREAHEPTEDERRRVRSALAAQLGVGTGLVATALAAPTVAAAGVPVATKVVLAVALAGAVGGGAVAYRNTRLERREAVRHVAAHVPARLASRPTAVPTPIAVAPPVERQAAAETTTPVAPTPARHPVGRRPVADRPVAAGGPTSAAPTPTTIEGETRLVRAAISARQAGDGRRALDILTEYARRYPNGVLAEECEAERVVTLAHVGRAAEARLAARLFLRTHPDSPLAERVRTAARRLLGDFVTDPEADGHSTVGPSRE